MISCLLLLDVSISLLVQTICKHINFCQKPCSIVVSKASALIHGSSKCVEGGNWSSIKYNYSPSLKKLTDPEQTNNTHLNGYNVFVLVYGFAYGGSGFYPVQNSDSVPGEPQLKVISRHDVTSLLPTHNWYQLLSFHQTFAGRVALEGCSALDLLWLLAPSLTDWVLWKPSGSSSSSSSSCSTATENSPASLPHAELNLVLEE